MPEPIRYPGVTWGDVCAFNGQWFHAGCVGNRVQVRTKAAIQWSVSVGVETIGVRSAPDHIGRIAVVGKRQDTGHIVAAINGQTASHAALRVPVHGPTGVMVTYDYISHEWLLWRMHDSFTLAKLRIDPNPFRVGEWEYQDIRSLMPEGTADGFSYALPGPDGYAIPQFTLLTRHLVPGLVNPVKAGDLWVGQHPSDGLAAVQDGVGRQTLHPGDAFEPHAVEYAPGQFVACSWDRTAKTARVVEFSTPLTPDQLLDLPIEDPGRPIATVLYYHRTQRYRETLRFANAWDVVADEPIPLARPSIIGAVVIPYASPDLVKGLYVGKEGTPQEVQAEVVATRKAWDLAHPGRPIPPVVVYVTHGMRQSYPNLPEQVDADVWSPELFYPLAFPDDPIEWLRGDVDEWLTYFGNETPWAPTCQAYSRNGAHTAVMPQVIAAQGIYTTLAKECTWWVGLLFFDCNRSGMVSYQPLAEKFQAINAVCRQPAQLAPSRPGTPLGKPPRITVVVDKTTVEPDEHVRCEVVPLDGSGPILEVEWSVDVIGDGQVSEFFDRTAGLVNTFWTDRLVQFEVIANAKGPGGAHEVRSPRITVQKKEDPVSNEEKKQLLDQFSLAILRTRDWLTEEVYPGLVGHPIDPDGYNQWLLNQWMRHYSVDLGYDEQKAKVYVFGDIHKQVTGNYPPTDPRANAGGGGGGNP